MKYIVLLGDGMSDEPLDQLGGKTPLQVAKTPNMDFMARNGLLGLAATVPEGLPPGSDVANLSVFGYDPRTCYTGRSPLEAASIGVELGPDDVAFRLNFVTLVPDGSRIYMKDFSAGHISTSEGGELIAALQKQLGDDEFQFFPGVGYRHLMVWRNGCTAMKTVPPHDITGKSILDYLPSGQGADRIVNLMNSSQMILHGHPLNKRREENDQLPANSIWLWGHGRPPQISSYRENYGLSGAVISAVDLLKGIGIYAGLDNISVAGATGYIDTNYRGKAEAALEALKTRDFVYLHVEAPDEASHAGRLDHKIQAIEDFDAKVVGTVLEGIKELGEYRILCMPDHPTPVSIMTHTSDPVPFVIYGGDGFSGNGGAAYDEASAKATGCFVSEGFRLMSMMMGRTTL
jgi:2,3-bisphosphoglycerate-independent phosphoglycerate mutase